MIETIIILINKNPLVIILIIGLIFFLIKKKIAQIKQRTVIKMPVIFKII